ncbi:MAG: hypothetical protein AAF825_01430 [Pseudomonadota bacterium]
MRRHALIPALTLSLASGTASAQVDWTDPDTLTRIIEATCLTSALIETREDRRGFMVTQFGFEEVPNFEEENLPELLNEVGIGAGWEPAISPSLFCVVTIPPELYDDSTVATIAEFLNEGSDAPVPEAADGFTGPIMRGILDGRTMGMILINDPSDGLAVLGAFEE